MAALFANARSATAEDVMSDHIILAKNSLNRSRGAVKKFTNGFMGAASFSHRDNFFRNDLRRTICFCEHAVSFKAFTYGNVAAVKMFSYLSKCFAVFPHRYSNCRHNLIHVMQASAPVTPSGVLVRQVFFLCYPLKIFYAVVGIVRVFMVNYERRAFSRYESKGY